MQLFVSVVQQAFSIECDFSVFAVLLTAQPFSGIDREYFYARMREKVVDKMVLQGGRCSVFFLQDFIMSDSISQKLMTSIAKSKYCHSSL